MRKVFNTTWKKWEIRQNYISHLFRKMNQRKKKWQIFVPDSWLRRYFIIFICLAFLLCFYKKRATVMFKRKKEKVLSSWWTFLLDTGFCVHCIRKIFTPSNTHVIDTQLIKFFSVLFIIIKWGKEGKFCGSNKPNLNFCSQF